MKQRRLRILNRLISWEDETQAMESVVFIDCPKCLQKITYIPIRHGVGELVDMYQLDISTYQKQQLLKLSKFYHASIRNISIKCTNYHSSRLLVVFGETQPARYVFMYIGVLLSK